MSRLSKLRFATLAASALLLSACAETELASHVIKQVPASQQSASQGTFKVGKPYNVAGRRYEPTEMYEYIEEGMASWYGPGFHGKRTANGETFNTGDMTAAHRTLQLPSIIRVTNLENGRSAILRVNDRGPFARDRVLDVSEEAAKTLGFKNKGKAKVRVELMPKESQIVASAAKQGRDTRGIEIGLNRAHRAQTGGAGYDSGYSKVTSVTPPRPAPVPIRLPEVSTETLPPYAAQQVATNSYAPTHMAAGTYYVQVGAFGNQANAQALSQSLSDLAGGARVISTDRNGVPLYRVQVGPMQSSQTAMDILPQVVDRGYPDAIVVAER
ncbi:MAG: septal ring lytic transglycosylase RlpA family protein [Pseudobdellovibrionaceae bacterium]